MITPEQIIERFSLKAHPEGGWYQRTYQSSLEIESPNGSRPVGTSILYLLERGDISRLHSLDADETWYFHLGSPLKLHMFSEDRYHSILLGDISKNADAHPQYTIPAEMIFGAVPCEASKGEYSLVSCSVSPGFIETGFRWSNASSLKEKFPKYLDLIEKMSHSLES